ncbi:MULTISPECIES: Gfo/Idh/MocA family protein [Halomicrobium]|uniref:Oxidoreductase domain protein n=2 Tax=Halomicrobium mukohataei TaxID=57705 RepID=C7P3B3_HALMD|nr:MULTISPECIES: Gfo/Idh/MocA family oxidoreductase [Halomicrobium]ACV47585.1 oxidoreductase domain protein [Halomicrobium mukohataei DSM 12286]QCD66048.1 Gfo/Idh/MocA family oxidoreductase [Halomicrobium mukohataei]QFR20853.1 hypothetical protein GBQ70_10485 [Halomicrobium sp. ZPS1]
MRILFTGLGSIGRRHLRLLDERPEEFEVHAYRSGTAEGDGPAGIVEHDSLEAGLAVDPDVAFVTNPTALHVETATRCARSGCDLFLEKPLSDSLAGVEELQQVVDERDLITYVGCQLRFSPVLAAVRDALGADRIGDVLSFRATAGSHLPEWRPGQDYRNSYSASSELGGGVVLDLVHELDYIYWLLGDVATVDGHIGHLSSLEIETEDVAEIVLRTRSGALGSVHLDYFRRVPKRTLVVIGEAGVVRADLNEQTVTIETPAETDHREFDYTRDDVFRDQLGYFLEHVRTREPCHNDVPEAKRVLEIALEAKENQV